MNMFWSWASDFWSRGDREAARTPFSTAALARLRTQVPASHSRHLMARLETDHAVLFERFGAVQALLDAKNYADIPAALTTFKVKFDVHVLNESLHFYSFLEERLQDQPEELTTMRKFRHEMDAIERHVVNFVDKYRNVGVASDNSKTFTAEYAEIGAALRARIENEEKTLYPLYQP